MLGKKEELFVGQCLSLVLTDVGKSRLNTRRCLESNLEPNREVSEGEMRLE